MNSEQPADAVESPVETADLPPPREEDQDFAPPAVLEPPMKPLLGSDELEDFVAYVRGETATPPACVTKVMACFTNKLTMLLGCNVVESLGRERRLKEFIEAAEGRVFSKEAIYDMDMKDLREMLTEAKKTVADLQEFRRKFVAQNKDALAMTGSPQEALLQKIMTMSPEQLSALQSKVEELMTVAPDPEVEETSPDAVAAELNAEQ